MCDGWEEVWDGGQEGPWGRNDKQRQREKKKRVVPAGVCGTHLDLYSLHFITGRLEFTGILTISLLHST